MNIALIRLLLMNNSGSRRRLLSIATGVAVGVALLLLIVAGYTGLQQREARESWTQPLAWGPAGDGSAQSSAHGLGAMSTEVFENKEITRIDVADPDQSVRLGSIDRFPKVGHYLASPALAALIDKTPGDELGDRYGRRSGLIPVSALASPDSLIVVAGESLERLAERPKAISLDGVGANPSGFLGSGDSDTSQMYMAVALIGGIAVLTPVLFFVAIISDLGSAERRERIASLRLIGAQPRDIARIAVAETLLTSLVGAVVGLGLAVLLVPLAAQVPVDAMTFFASDLVSDPWIAGLVVTGTVTATTLVAWLRARRTVIGSLGGSRYITERSPRPGGLIVLATGAVISASSGLAGAVLHMEASFLPFLGFLLILIGLPFAGRYLTHLASRVLARRARDAGGVVAFNRIRRNSRSTFRAVSGLIMAAFLVSLFAGAITTDRTEAGPPDPVDQLWPTAMTAPAPVDRVIPKTGVLALRNVAGIGHAFVTYPTFMQQGPGSGSTAQVLDRADAQMLGLVKEEMQGEASAYVKVIPAKTPGGAITVSDTSDIDPSQMSGQLIIVPDGTQGSTERARTAVIRSGIPLAGIPTSAGEGQGTDSISRVSRYAALANLGILAATFVAVLSLAVATMSGILDRRRVFGLMRLTGMPARVMRRIVARELLLPLVTVFFGSIGLGFLSAWGIVSGFTGGRRTIYWPDPSYGLVLLVSCFLVLTAIAITARAAQKSTNIVTRFE